MKVISAQDIKANIKLEDLIEPMRHAFQAYSKGDSSDAIGFLRPNGGEVHIKSGFIKGSKVFAVKVSAGFATNAARGLPAWDGAVMAFDATTGAPVAIIQDGGLLTDWRTAAAGAVASAALARANSRTLGMVGTGIQAFWQPLAHKALFALKRILIWGRSHEKANALRNQLEPLLQGIEILVQPNLQEVIQQSDILVTATSSLEPLIQTAWVQAGTHITAVGADDEHKRELEPSLLEKADILVVDSLSVNQKYGDVARGLQSGLDIKPIELGSLLEQPALGRHSDAQITIAKLVGLGVQDLAATQVVLEQCSKD